MTPPRLEDVLAGLNALNHADGVPDNDRAVAQQMAARLSKAVQVAVIGPVAEANTFLHAGLTQSGLIDPGLVGLSVDLGDPDPSAFANVDLVLWATFVFGTEEVTAWSMAPVALQDRSFLVPLLPDAEVSEGLLADLRTRAADMFDTIHPIPMKAATQPSADLARRMMRRVCEGRQADLDHAALLLGRHDLNEKAKPAASPQTQPEAKQRENASTNAAAKVLQDHAKDLCARDLTADAACISSLLQSCEETAEAVCTLLEGHDADLYADAMQAYDNIVLMALEHDLTAATDAVTTLMHLRRDLHIELAS